VLRHRDKRTNIPTDELRAFVAEDEDRPVTALYPRDPSLDPQLVWRGKDEQDRGDLEVPTVPIYIQEKVHPRVLVENLRRTAQRPHDEPELTLFADFNGIEFEELVDFYAHEQNWTNRLILGDSLLVMTSLAEKENLRGKVQTIYFDPPYGIRFGSNWQVSTRHREVKDGKTEDLSRQPEQIRAFRDTWKDGINSYLAYLRDRLTVAHGLLANSGSVFVQIGDENVHLVRSLLDEVFGRENFVSQITVRKTTGFQSVALAATADFVLWYARDIGDVKYRQLYTSKVAEDEGADRYDRLLLADGTSRAISREEREGRVPLPPQARRYQLDNLTSSEHRPDTSVPFDFGGRTFTPGHGHWKTSVEGLQRLAAAGRLEATSGTLRYRRMLDDFAVKPISNLWNDISGAVQSRSDPKIYVVQSSTALIERCLLMTTDPGDLVLDPTAGGGTTPVAAESWGRRWIGVDTSRVALALARTRLMSLRLPYHLLADSPAGRDQETAITGSPPSDTPPNGDVRRGFVYRRVPRVTLAAIAHNDAITDGRSPDQIERAIASRASQTPLFDQPYEDRRIVRVCGPFTVESLSPHRLLSAAEVPEAENVPQSSGGFEDTILGNLRKAGVQNRDRAQRLDFDTLDPYAGGRWIQARGAFTDEAGQTRTVGISLGPEYGTVGSDQVREAAKEAVKGVGFDLLLVCGFAFDAHSNEAAREFAPETNGGGWAVATEERRFGKLPVMLVRMNQDLSMGEDLLKKTGAGNLFMVFGEPDVQIDETDDGRVEIEVRGVDVYDPTTGEIRSDSTDDIACWFIDTDYNGESFFVRDAYFTGANDPYKRLRQALKADIDREAWESLYRTRSRPFPKPSTGTIAVKVINHHGDEVLKTYPVA
jgi:adenine-specific DNA-methyltransferase